MSNKLNDLNGAETNSSRPRRENLEKSSSMANLQEGLASAASSSSTGSSGGQSGGGGGQGDNTSGSGNAKK
ncbi:MAG: hypothetical protein EOR86_07575 [Mesorhizobium sp.]|uniref:hypothetical protein n=1 Tax=Mesorhizobium sp. TaxID=1871066 RepID=UPI000FE7AFAC|nr:hypothetical protein [Mesorhizobium sp.]RWM97678.1 MAG: hypothetical protein EOR86_07575 [Mesorhizobium sp.]